MLIRVSCFLLAALGTACAAAADTNAPVEDSVDHARAMRDCATQGFVAPEHGFNFDLFVAASEDLALLFPGSLPPRSAPLTKTVKEIRNPFDGTLIAGPFEPPLAVLSYEPDGPWTQSDVTLNFEAVRAKNLPWIQCGGLGWTDFESLGDALNLPRPSPDEAQRALRHVPDRLSTPIFFPPGALGDVKQFPGDFRDALAAVREPKELGVAWSAAFRARHVEATASAKALGISGREEPPPDVEALRPYFSGLGSDIVELARVGNSTKRNLYLYFWPD